MTPVERKTIVHLTTVHPRDDVRILLKQAHTLARAESRSVALVVADGKGCACDTRDGVSVAIHDVGSLAGGRFGRFILGTWRAFRRVRQLAPAVVHFHDPELIPAAIALKCAGHTIVYDVHEDVPRQMLTKLWLPRMLRWPIARVMAALEWLAAKLFDAIVPATPKIAARFPAHKTAIVQNFPMLSEFIASDRPPYADRPASFVYLGGISALRGARQMVEAVQHMRSDGEVRLELAGNFIPAELKTELQQLPGWRGVNFHGYVSRTGVANLINRARAGLVVLHPTENYPDAYPVKMFEYMAAGLPVIASDFPLWREIVEAAGCGMLVDPLDTAAIAAAMQWMLDHPREADEMGRRGRHAVEQTYNWSRESAKLIELYERLLPTKAGPPVKQPTATQAIDSTYKICLRCIMDTSDPGIVFDDQGVCNHCTEAVKRMRNQLLPADERQRVLARLVEKIRREGKTREYDCIIGMSGGVDSSTVACKVKELGLRPLAVHFDNGWDSELAVDNIKRLVDKLGIDLHTHVVDWEEFRDLQLCFLRASVANCEIPTDHGITALLFAMASRVGTRFIISGSNLVTEAIMPYAWGHYNQDLRHIKALHRSFGSIPLATMPLISLFDYLYLVLGRGIRQIPLLNCIDYKRDSAKQMLAQEMGWRDYGCKHCESIWTRFFQGYYLPVKFGYDKRRAYLSTLICSGQMSRDAALKEMCQPTYPPELMRQDRQFVLKKFGLSEAQFQAIMNAPLREARDYPSHYFLFHTLQRYKNLFRKIATTP